MIFFPTAACALNSAPGAEPLAKTLRLPTKDIAFDSAANGEFGAAIPMNKALEFVEKLEKFCSIGASGKKKKKKKKKKGAPKKGAAA